MLLPHSSTLLKRRRRVDVGQFDESKRGDEEYEVGDPSCLKRVAEEETESREKDCLGFGVAGVERWEGGFGGSEVLE